MPRKKKVDSAALMQAIDDGRTSREMMIEFGFKTLAQLKAAYVDAMAERSMIPNLSAGRARKESEEGRGKELKINKRGSLVVPREILAEMGFNIGDSFLVHKSTAGVSLKRAKPLPEK